ncbi:MAG TPA: DUF4349 domain-containing protein [Acidimicrobiales bacterium]|nr:DUF4349 domain-containing protein [Acidimicrobiales bacterium]
MTMLDDDQLASLFVRAGEAFDVPASGAADIVARATGAVARGTDDAGVGGAPSDAAEGETPDEPDQLERARAGRTRRLAATAGRHRVLSVAACLALVLVVGGTVGALTRSTSAPSLNASAAHTGPVHPLAQRVPAAPSTTVPSAASGSASPQFKAAAPSPTNGYSTSTQSNAQLGASTPAATVPTSPTAPSLPSGAVGQSSKIEQTGSLGLTVRKGALGRTMTRLTALAGSAGGFVASSQTQSGSGASSGGAPYGSITLQVPVDTFASVLKQAQSFGTTSNLTTHATNVTGQYVNLQARISALQTSEQQYLTIMSKATTVGDVLSVQEQIDTIQSQIEQLQGQLQLLTSETSYSTLAVTLNEPTSPVPPGPLPESGVVRAWHNSVDGFLSGVDGLIRLAGPLLFALLCLAVLVVGGRALWRRYQRHNL